MVKPKRSLGAFTLIELLVVVGIISILAAIAVPNYLEAQVRSKVARAKSDLRAVSVALEAYDVDHNELPFGRILCGYHHVFEFRDCEWVYNIYGLSTPVAYLTSTNQPDPFIRTRRHVHLPFNQATVLPVVPVNVKPPISETAPTVAGDVIYCPPGEPRDPRFTYMYDNFSKYDDEGRGIADDGVDYAPDEMDYYTRTEETERQRPRWFLVSVGPDGTAGIDHIDRRLWTSYAYIKGNDHTRANIFSEWLYDPTNGTTSAGDIIRYQKE